MPKRAKEMARADRLQGLLDDAVPNFFQIRLP